MLLVRLETNTTLKDKVSAYGAADCCYLSMFELNSLNNSSTREVTNSLTKEKTDL